MNYQLFIEDSIKNMGKEEQKQWLDQMMKIIEGVNLWEEADKDIYLILSHKRSELCEN